MARVTWSSLNFGFQGQSNTLQICHKDCISTHVLLHAYSRNCLWPPCVADADIIFVRWFLSIFLFFPRLISAVADWMSTIHIHTIHMVCSANLECRCEMCCTQLAVQDPKNRHLAIIAQLCRAISSQVRHVSTIGKKLIKQQYLLHMSLQYGILRPNGWDRLAGLGYHSKFQRVSRLGFVTAATSFTGGQPNFARCLAVSCLVHTFLGAFASWRNFATCKLHFAAKSCVVLYW